MLAQDFGRFLIAINVIEPNDGCCNCFSYSIKRQSIVLLVKLIMWDGRAVKPMTCCPLHVSFLANRQSQVMQGIFGINGIVHTGVGSNDGSCCYGCLLLGVPVNGSLVGKVQDAGHWPFCEGHGTSLHPHSAWGWQTFPMEWVCQFGWLYDMSIDSIYPVKLLVWQNREVRLLGMEPNNLACLILTRYEMMHCTFHVSLEQP